MSEHAIPPFMRTFANELALLRDLSGCKQLFLAWKDDARVYVRRWPASTVVASNDARYDRIYPCSECKDHSACESADICLDWLERP